MTHAGSKSTASVQPMKMEKNSAMMLVGPGRPGARKNPVASKDPACPASALELPSNAERKSLSGASTSSGAQPAELPPPPSALLAPEPPAPPPPAGSSSPQPAENPQKSSDRSVAGFHI